MDVSDRLKKAAAVYTGWGFKFAGPASAELIGAAEANMGLALTGSFRRFIELFGTQTNLDNGYTGINPDMPEEDCRDNVDRIRDYCRREFPLFPDYLIPVYLRFEDGLAVALDTRQTNDAGETPVVHVDLETGGTDAAAPSFIEYFERGAGLRK